MRDILNFDNASILNPQVRINDGILDLKDTAIAYRLVKLENSRVVVGVEVDVLLVLVGQLFYTIKTTVYFICFDVVHKGKDELWVLCCLTLGLLIGPSTTLFRLSDRIAPPF